MRLSNSMLLWIAGFVVLVGAVVYWTQRNPAAPSAAGSGAYEKVGGKFADSFSQDPVTSKPMAVAPGDLPPVSLTDQPIAVR